MRKSITTLACGLVLAMGVSQANAALLTDWTYELTNTSLSNFNTDFVDVYTNSNGKESMTFTSGDFTSRIEPNGTFGGNFAFSDDKTSASTANDRYLVQSSAVTESNNFVDANRDHLADLSFTYIVASVDQPTQRMRVTYEIPLYTYYSPDFETAFVYYNNSDVGTRGSTALTYDGYKYGVTGIGLFVDGRALVTVPGEDQNDNNLYSGWAINIDTIMNNYEEYVVGGDSNVSIGLKNPQGSFNITGVFSMAVSPVAPPPAPTPEPATMLLTGLGLAGLGAVKRRRNKKAA